MILEMVVLQLRYIQGKLLGFNFEFFGFMCNLNFLVFEEIIFLELLGSKLFYLGMFNLFFCKFVLDFENYMSL